MAEIDVSQIKASALGINGGTTGKKYIILVTGAPKRALEDGLTYFVDGPAKPDVMCNSDTYDESVEISIVALIPGDYKIAIEYKGIQITGSPFNVTINGDRITPAQLTELISKVNVHSTFI